MPEPAVKDVYTIDLEGIQPQDKREYLALHSWSMQCVATAKKHADAASFMRVVNALSTSMVIGLSSAVAILMGISAEAGVKDYDMSVSSLVLSSAAGAISAISTIYNPSGKRDKHLLASNLYTILSREIAVYLLNMDNIEEAGSYLKPELAVKDFQGRLDTLDSVSPDL